MYPDARLHDRVAFEEIQLYAEVLTAVASARDRLDLEEIDELLGVPRQRGLEF